MSGSTRRKDDTYIKWLLGIGASIVVLFAGQFIFMLQSNAAMVEKVKTNSMDIAELKDFKFKLIRIEVMSEMTVTKVNELAGHMKGIADEQQRRTPIIKNAERYLKKTK